MARVPADLGPALRERVRDSAPDGRRSSVDGLARVDVFLTGMGRSWSRGQRCPGSPPNRPSVLGGVRRGLSPGARPPVCHGCGPPRRSGPSIDIEPVPTPDPRSTCGRPPGADWRVIGELTVAAYASIPGSACRRRSTTVNWPTSPPVQTGTPSWWPEDADGFVVGAVGYGRIPGTGSKVSRARQVSVDPAAVGASVEHWSRRS